MPETRSRAGEAAMKPKGGRAVFGAAMAIVGALAALNPANPLLVTLNDVVPRLAETLPPVITACGAILAAVSEPPRVGRRK